MRRAYPRAFRAALLLLPSFLIANPAPAQSAPPSTPKREVADTYFGTVIADPYRWMEPPVPDNPEFKKWLEAQNAHTRQVLDSLPHREAAPGSRHAGHRRRQPLGDRLLRTGA